MDGQAEDVVVVAQVEPLRVLQTVVDDGDSSHVVHHLPRLGVEQVVPAVKAPIPEDQETTPMRGGARGEGSKVRASLGFRRKD